MEIMFTSSCATQRRSMDEKGLKELNARQDAVVIKQGSSSPYVSEVKYDPNSFNKLRSYMIGPYGIKNAIIHKGFVENLEDIIFPHYQMVNMGGWAGLPGHARVLLRRSTRRRGIQAGQSKLDDL